MDGKTWEICRDCGRYFDSEGNSVIDTTIHAREVRGLKRCPPCADTYRTLHKYDDPYSINGDR